MARIGWYVLGSVLVGYGALQVLGRRAGSTAEERRMRMPGDELVAQPHILTNHAITIEARPVDVWPWLTQMGWHLGGWYTPEWVDRLLFPQNWPSLDHLDLALLRNLDVGDTIPDGPPGTAELWWWKSTRRTRWCCARRRICRHLAGEVRCRDRLDVELPAHRTPWRQNSAAAAGPRANRAAMADCDLPGHHHPGRLHHGRRDAARDQTTRRIWRVAEVVRQVTTVTPNAGNQ